MTRRRKPTSTVARARHILSGMLHIEHNKRLELHARDPVMRLRPGIVPGPLPPIEKQQRTTAAVFYCVLIAMVMAEILYHGFRYWLYHQ